MMDPQIFGVPLVIWSFNLFLSTEASCTKPALSSNSYTLTDDKSSYAVNETYEVYCIPGYITSGGSNLVCGSSNKWSLSTPVCTPSEGVYPWWMLLMAVLLFILLVACILPKLLQCCLTRTIRKGNGNEARDLEQNNGDYDDDDDCSPVPDFTKHKKMSNIEFMAKFNEDTHKETLKHETKNSAF